MLPGRRSRIRCGCISLRVHHMERKLQTAREGAKGAVRAARARSYTEDVKFSPEDGSRSDVER